MKQLSILLVCGLFALAQLSGCQSHSRDASGVAPAPPRSRVGVIVEGGGEFPEFLVGTWRTEGKSGWEFSFEPDGTISSVVIALGRVRIRPNQKTEVQGRKGEPGIYEAGDCEAYYDPASRDLSVVIKMKRIYAEIAGGIIDGTCEYYIGGSVSEDGENWDADVVVLLDLSVQLPDPNSTKEEPTFKQVGFLRTTPDEGSKQRFVFTKVKDSTQDNK